MLFRSLRGAQDVCEGAPPAWQAREAWIAAPSTYHSAPEAGLSLTPPPQSCAQRFFPGRSGPWDRASPSAKELTSFAAECGEAQA